MDRNKTHQSNHHAHLHTPPSITPPPPTHTIPTNRLPHPLLPSITPIQPPLTHSPPPHHLHPSTHLHTPPTPFTSPHTPHPSITPHPHPLNPPNHPPTPQPSPPPRQSTDPLCVTSVWRSPSLRNISTTVSIGVWSVMVMGAWNGGRSGSCVYQLLQLQSLSHVYTPVHNLRA